MYGEKNSVVTRKSRFPFQGASLIVLSLLLVGTVGGLIYMSISSQMLCQQKQVVGVDMEADVTIKSDHQEKKEKITYNQGSRVAYYRGEDDSFEVDDFGKGLHIIRAPGNKVCYVIPVGAESTSNHRFESLLQRSSAEGQMRVNETVDVNVEILPGDIEDVSFIPEGAHKECTNGYRWMVVSKAPADERREKRQVDPIMASIESNTTTSALDTNTTTTAELPITTKPSALACTYCYLFYVQTPDALYLYEACFTIVGFEFCHVLYRDGERPTLNGL